jgi:hypothetical protein
MVGDVRLTVTRDDSGVRRAVYAVRRRAARTPAETAHMVADLTAAGGLLRREARLGLLQGRELRRTASAELASA